jgi:hypothetical protein
MPRATGINQPNVLQVSHLKFKSEHVSEQMTQHWVSTKRVKPVPSHLLKSGVSTIQNIFPTKATSTNTTTQTTMRKPSLSNWRRTKTTKGRPWAVPPLHLNATSPHIPVLSTRGRTPSKLTTCRLSRPNSSTMTRRTETTQLTTSKTTTPRILGGGRLNLLARPV